MKRARNIILFWGAVVLAVAPVFIGAAPPEARRFNHPVKEQPANRPPLALCAPCEVVKVHDGDTATDVVLQIHVQVRYDRCWAPELSQSGGPESRDSAKLVEGKRGRLFIPLNNSGNLADLFTFGRVVGEIWPDGATESESQRQVRLKQASTTKGGQLGE